MSNNYTVDAEKEDDGRWIAEVLEVRGAMAYGATKEEAIANAMKVADQATATINSMTSPDKQD